MNCSVKKGKISLSLGPELLLLDNIVMKPTQLKILLFFILILTTLSGCNPSSTATSTADPTVPTPGPTVTLSGTLTYDFVPANSGKLNYAGAISKPMRNVYVELINSLSGALIASTSTNDSGQYTMSVPSSVNVKLRIYAEMKTPAVIIQDNTNSGAEYVLSTSSFILSADTNKDVRATSGWSGSNAGGSYTSSRLAAPFAILDDIYTVSKKMLTARPALSFPTCRINWSINNISTDGSKAQGQIGTSHYDPDTNQMYILGQADVDSDEFDNHVIVHEWGHFFESNLSRSDSKGGSHSMGDAKDISLAFGEGWGNALSAMAFDDPIYADTYGSKQQSGFTLNMENGNDANKGWFSETSIQQILYDIYDSNNEAGDAIDQGIGPIVDVFTGYQKTTPAPTSIFSFIYGLKQNVPGIVAELNTLTTNKNMTSVTSPYGDGETHDGSWDKNLPIDNQLTLGGAAVSVWLYGDFGQSDFYGLYNTAFNNKYLRFTATSSSTRLVVTSTDTFQIEVYDQGANVFLKYQPRTSGAAFGPFTYNFSTTAGKEYRINLLTDQTAVYSSASVVSLTVTGTAL